MSTRVKSVLKIFCAILAGLVSALLGQTYSFADVAQASTPPCSSADYLAYREELKTVPIEGTPQEHLLLAESFLSKCANRPEVGRVALEAGRNALDSGDAKRALGHYNTARARFGAFQQQDRLDYMTTLILNGEAELAWRLRDEEIKVWLEKLEDDGLAVVKTTRVRDGLIYKVTYEGVDPVRRETDAWLLAPFGAGFPATISLSADQTLAALLKIRLGERAAGLQQLKLRRCHGQVTLMSQADGISMSNARARAMAAAKAYLANPDGVLKTEKDQPIATCFHTDRLFIAPDPETAELLY